MWKRPLVIGIAGPSCSGKTTLARGLCQRLPGGGLVFELDWYYHDQFGHTVDDIDVDVPEAIDHELAVSQLHRLVEGHAVERPDYDYATHSRAPRGVPVQPAANIVVEGLFALYWSELRAVFRHSIFVLAEDAICLQRRIERDTRERGRSVEDVVRQYHRKVKPMYESHVHPTRHHAGLVLHGVEAIGTLLDRAVEWIRYQEDKGPSRGGEGP
jgi:uridine kinase